MIRSLRCRWLTAALGLLALAGCGSGSEAVAWPAVKDMIRKKFPAVEQISTADLQAWLEKGDQRPLLVDVRSEDEFRVSHLRDAVRVDPGAANPLAGVATDTPIVTYCSVGYRSSRTARRLSELGFTDVRNLEGSIFEWANQGRPVVRGGREVRQVHPYDERWGRLLAPELHAWSEE